MAVKTDTQATTLPTQERKPQETIDSSSRGDIPLRWFTSILLLVFPTATLFVNRGDSYVLGFLTLIGIWVWLRDGARRWLDRPTALLWIAFVLFFAVALLSYLLGTQTDAGFRFLGRYLRFLLIAPVYLALRRYPPAAKTVFLGLALGALVSGILAALQFLHATIPIRVQATTGLSIIFGDLATTMVIGTVAGFGLMTISKHKWVIALLALCVAGGGVATLLSGTRGAWLPLLLLIPALVTAPSVFKRRYQLLIFVTIITIFSASYFIARTDTRVRLIDGFKNTINYFVALNTLDHSNLNSQSRFQCSNTQKFLAAWIDVGAANSSMLHAQVVNDATLIHNNICRLPYAVRIDNSGKSGLLRFDLPRVSQRGDGAQLSKILIKGSGMIRIGWSTSPPKEFNEVQYAPFILNEKAGAAFSISIYVPQKSVVKLVPLNNFFGEYTFSIADNSVGKRFEMWRAAWKMFLGHPLLGVGMGAYQMYSQRLILTDEIAPFVQDYDHPHNDYLNALASSGVAGFLALLAILVVPVVRFWRAVRSKDAVSHAIGLAGALTVLGFAIYALTDTIFLHSMMITWYVVYMALFYALQDVQANKLAKPPLPIP
ncbi:MAG TPA: O-antigen ligase family protein [Gammaproteobacteria bacterium]|nr:O-antigen ligase family protein [Gammaproteobacteria bacterium]